MGTVSFRTFHILHLVFNFSITITVNLAWVAFEKYRIKYFIVVGSQFVDNRLSISKLNTRHPRDAGPGCAIVLLVHYINVIMSELASQIAGVSIICSIVCSGADQRKHQSFVSLAFCEGNPPVTCGFPSKRASNAENVSIRWRHHG